MILRDADARDAHALAELMTELGYPASSDSMRERLASLLPAPDYHTLVAEDDGEVQGMVGMGVGRYYERPGVYGRILALVVREGARGGGVGRALLEAAEEWLRARGARAIYINSGSHRRETHEFYVRRGYAQTGLRFTKESMGKRSTSDGERAP